MISISRLYAIPFLMATLVALFPSDTVAEQVSEIGKLTHSSEKLRARDPGIRPGFLSIN